jgi:hypothetical protein
MRMLDMRLCDSSFNREPLQSAGMPEMRIKDDKSLKQATRRFTMPGRDKTGPTGRGPMTGRGAGLCDDSADNTESAPDIPAVGRGLGRQQRNRGRGQGRRRRFGANGVARSRMGGRGNIDGVPDA